MKLSHEDDANFVRQVTHDQAHCSLASLGGGPLAELYKNVRLQFQETKRHRNFGKLWSSVAPNGNIYRYNGLSQERMRHCLDLDQQLQLVAEKHKSLLGGDDVSLEARSHRLVKALRQTPMSGIARHPGLAGILPEDFVESARVPCGFLPLEEFLETNVTSTLGVVHPFDREERSQWFFNNFMAILVFIIQTCGPLMVIIQLWYGPDNQVRDLHKLWKHLTLKEALCLGVDRTAVLTTCMGTVFLLLVCIKIYQYCIDESAGATKMGRLPTDNFWLFFGNFAHTMSSVLIVIAVPLEFWQEPGTTGIMMNCMALLFVFSLDDLAGDMFSYIGDDDSEFQKQVSWNYALLAYCPVNLQDLINPMANTAEELWKISYNSDALLLSADGCVCETRIMAAKIPAKESSALMKQEDNVLFNDLPVQYRIGPSSKMRHLPGYRSVFIRCLWFVTKWLVGVMTCVFPVVWFVLNKPCTPS